MDSTGLGAMVHAYATATRQGGSVKLLNSTKKLHDLLVITKLSTVFESFDSESAAVASLTLSPPRPARLPPATASPASPTR